MTSDPGVQQRICCGDARQRIGIEQLGQQVLQQRRVRLDSLRMFEVWICERKPVSLGPAAFAAFFGLGLEVRHAQASVDAGVVEFVARCRDNGRAQRLHETSRFVREQGRWYYVDGIIEVQA